MMNFDTTIISTVYAAINSVCKKYGYDYRFPNHERQDLAGDILEHIVNVQNSYDSSIASQNTWVFNIAWNKTLSFLETRFPKAGSKGRKTRLVNLADKASFDERKLTDADLYSHYYDTLSELDEDGSYESVIKRDEHIMGLSAKAQVILEQLPPVDKGILICKSKGYHSDRIAEELGLTVSTVNTRYNRIPEKIQRIMQKNPLLSRKEK